MWCLVLLFDGPSSSSGSTEPAGYHSALCERGGEKGGVVVKEIVLSRTLGVWERGAEIGNEFRSLIPVVTSLFGTTGERERGQ